MLSNFVSFFDERGLRSSETKRGERRKTRGEGKKEKIKKKERGGMRGDMRGDMRGEGRICVRCACMVEDCGRKIVRVYMCVCEREG